MVESIINIGLDSLIRFTGSIRFTVDIEDILDKELIASIIDIS